MSWKSVAPRPKFESVQSAEISDLLPACRTRTNLQAGRHVRLSQNLGDMDFQAKSYEWIRDFRRAGKDLFVVSSSFFDLPTLE